MRFPTCIQFQMKIKITDDVSLPVYTDKEDNWCILVDQETLDDLKNEIQNMIDEEMLNHMIELSKQHNISFKKPE